MGNRGRKSIEIDMQAIQAEIYRLESNGPLANLGVLWNALAEKFGVSTTTIMNRCKAGNAEIKTQAGKRGGEGGDFGRSKGIKPDHSTRKRRGMPQAVADHILNNLPSYTKPGVRVKVEKLCESAVKGSSKASAQLKCLNCANYQPNEVRLCPQIGSCETYHIRPYKGKAIAEDEESDIFAETVEA